jgi:hypothetical protein
MLAPDARSPAKKRRRAGRNSRLGASYHLECGWLRVSHRQGRRNVGGRRKTGPLLHRNHDRSARDPRPGAARTGPFGDRARHETTALGGRSRGGDRPSPGRDTRCPERHGGGRPRSPARPDQLHLGTVARFRRPRSNALSRPQTKISFGRQASMLPPRWQR